MAALRQPRPDREPERRALRLVTPGSAADAVRLAEAEASKQAFNHGLRWGIAVSALGFWLPVAAALYAWLK
ncbi:MAG: hypothetical protein U0360_03125 [Dehalococcoidia bacterium]